MGLYALDENYGVETWYDYSGAYDLWAGTDLQLELTRHIIGSDAYVFQGIAWPKGKDTEINFQQTFSGSLNLIPYSFLVGITAFSQNNGMYTLRIYDKGAQTDMFYGQFAWYPTVVGTMQEQFSASGQFINLQTQNVPFGPYFLRSPLIILPPGDLQLQLTNVEEQPIPGEPKQQIQLFFMVAAPKNTVTMNTRKVQTASDPSGIQSIGAFGAILQA